MHRPPLPGLWSHLPNSRHTSLLLLSVCSVTSFCLSLLSTPFLSPSPAPAGVSAPGEPGLGTPPSSVTPALDLHSLSAPGSQGKQQGRQGREGGEGSAGERGEREQVSPLLLPQFLPPKDSRHRAAGGTSKKREQCPERGGSPLSLKQTLESHHEGHCLKLSKHENHPRVSGKADPPGPAPNDLFRNWGLVKWDQGSRPDVSPGTCCPPPRLGPLSGRARTHHVFDQQVSGGEGNRVGGRRDREHEGIRAADCAGDHQVEGVHPQADGLDRGRGGGGDPGRERERSDDNRWRRLKATTGKTRKETHRDA